MGSNGGEVSAGDRPTEMSTCALFGGPAQALFVYAGPYRCPSAASASSGSDTVSVTS
jgi:hypothetical protein